MSMNDKERAAFDSVCHSCEELFDIVEELKNHNAFLTDLIIKDNLNSTGLSDDELFITCDCGCDNTFHFRFFDDIIYVTFLKGYFYTEQSNLSEKLRNKIRLLFKKRKNRWIAETIITESSLLSIIKFLEEHKCSDEEVDNAGFLDCVSFNDVGLEEEKKYGLYLYTMQSRFDIVRGKEYRCGEIALNGKEKRKLIRVLKNAIRKKEAIRKT